MSENTVKKAEPRISRLDLVKSGAVTGGALKLPKRGRVVVDIDAIIPDPANERKNFRGIDELAASIKQVGIVESPTVVALEDGRYMLSTGERRWRAAKAAGLKQIAVIIGDLEEERTRRVKSLVSNVQREDLGALELSQAIQEMKEENPEIKTNRDLASLIGKSEQWIGSMLKTLSLPEDIQKEIREAERIIPYDSVIQIARLEDEAAQRDLLKEVLAGASVRQVREQAKSSKPSSKRAGKPVVRSTQKIATSRGWVIIHCDKKTAKKDDYVAALTEAMKAVKQMDL
jgi:ParB family chromosome partitioning protein